MIYSTIDPSFVPSRRRMTIQSLRGIDGGNPIHIDVILRLITIIIASIELESVIYGHATQFD